MAHEDAAGPDEGALQRCDACIRQRLPKPRNGRYVPPQHLKQAKRPGTHHACVSGALRSDPTRGHQCAVVAP